MEHLGIEPSMPEAADLQSAESPLILLLQLIVTRQTNNPLVTQQNHYTRTTGNHKHYFTNVVSIQHGVPLRNRTATKWFGITCATTTPAGHGKQKTQDVQSWVRINLNDTKIYKRTPTRHSFNVV